MHENRNSCKRRGIAKMRLGRTKKEQRLNLTGRSVTQLTNIGRRKAKIFE